MGSRSFVSFLLRAAGFVVALAAGGWALNELQNRGEFAAIPRGFLWAIVLAAAAVWAYTLLTSDAAKNHYYLLKTYRKRMLAVFLIVPMLFGLLAYLVIYRKAESQKPSPVPIVIEARIDPITKRLRIENNGRVGIHNIEIRGT